MRPAGGGRPLQQQTIVALTKERENAAVRSLSVEAAEFSLRPGPRTRVTAGADSDGGGGGDSPPSHLDSKSRVVRGDAAVSTAVEAGAVALSNFAGAIAPVDFAGITVPAVAGMRFSAVAEVHSLAVDDEDDPSVVRANEHRSAVVLDRRAAPGNYGRPMKGISVLEPLEHSVLEVALDGRPMEGISVLEPLEHSVLEVALDGRPTEGISVLEPLEHSVPDVALDRGDSSLVKIAVSNSLEHSGLDRTDDVVPGLVLPEPLDHSVLVVPLEEGDVSVTDVTVLDPIEHSGVEVRTETISAYLPRVFSEDPSKEGGGPRDHRGEDISLLDSLPEVGRTQPEDGEAIVVGAVGSAAPWFLTGWANDMQVEFMIDTGCQVTTLATTVFKRICTADPMVWSRLRPCRRRLFLADSSP